MKDVTLEALEDYLKTGCSPNRTDVADVLIQKGFVECNFRAEIPCPISFCDAYAYPPNQIGNSDEVIIVCKATDSHRTTIDRTDLLRCSLSPETVLDALCNHLDVARDGEIENNLPTHISCPTTNDVDIYLITDPDQEEQTSDRIVREAIEHDRIVVLLSLQDTVDHIIDVTERYSTTTVRPYVFSNLNETDILHGLVRSATTSRDRNRSVQELYDLDEDQTLSYLSANPGRVGEKLAHLRILRDTNGASNEKISSQFEKTCRIAFMALEGVILPDRGGEDDNFENIADTAFEFPPGGRGFPGDSDDEYDEIFGVVDAKSGQEARLDDEEIIRKHKRYLDRTDIEPLRHHHITHVIITHELSGAEDIRWYKRLKEAYKGDYSVVILKTGALYQLVESFAAPLVKNELKLSERNPLEIIRPLFDSRVHERELSPPVKRITRENPPKTKLPDYYVDYEQALMDCSELLVVTEEMVIKHLDEVFDSDVIKRRHRDYYQE